MADGESAQSKDCSTSTPHERLRDNILKAIEILRSQTEEEVLEKRDDPESNAPSTVIELSEKLERAERKDTQVMLLTAILAGMKSVLEHSETSYDVDFY